MEDEDNSPEFTLAEILQMENLFKEMREKATGEEFCQELSTKFNGSIHRSEKPPIKWEQVQSWFCDKQTNSAAVVVPFKPKKGTAGSKTAIIKKRSKVPTIPASEAAVELQTLIFEARSAKDSAWFDVASFLSYRIFHSGDLHVRVRFSGFGKDEDEWVSVSKAVRERSIPLEHSECDKVSVGDLVLCFREAEDHALYCDAHVVEIERKVHDSSICTCVFAVRWDHDNVEGKVTAEKLCYRPTKPAAKDSEECKLVPLQPSGVQNLLQLL
ncbi:protein SAWADEE HOMEODOMAIN HOMOLOG 1-like [Salvia miltiorrhiza]|uniref:protein SAWADEE HOMEODOMAIN HOMOLOG 1-like n=1 Tax=Salvia miltiorrhiza TaxID=226208 RepID=UPI0025ABDC43|nr:protein SAWADEE HOMEODOMAIN HOMOLOG 1-like [Salvia miltiorrhiza]